MLAFELSIEVPFELPMELPIELSMVSLCAQGSLHVHIRILIQEFPLLHEKHAVAVETDRSPAISSQHTPLSALIHISAYISTQVMHASQAGIRDLIIGEIDCRNNRCTFICFSKSML